ncbi:ceramide-1-phosphate transfer protein [Haemaphysalis longicornis]
MSVFSLRTVIEKLQSSLEDEDDLDMDSYLAAYKELCKFFQGLGSVFGFINSDVKSKIEILEEYRRSDDVGDSYATLNSMIEYEKEAGTIADEKKPSGSRTLLRLHRALEFIAKLFRSLTSANDDTSVGKLAKASYDETLSKHHPWLIRKGAAIAMLTLPSVKQLFAKALPEEKEDLRSLLESLADEAERVYNFTQSVYEENNILELP